MQARQPLTARESMFRRLQTGNLFFPQASAVLAVDARLIRLIIRKGKYESTCLLEYIIGQWHRAQSTRMLLRHLQEKERKDQRPV